MQVETIRDVLNWTVTFHKNLKDCLKHCSEQNKGMVQAVNRFSDM